jgi:acyl carrier protein
MIGSAGGTTGPQIQTPTYRDGNSPQDAIAKIWSEVLRLPHVDNHANFFEIGGDSLKAMDVIARVSEVLKVDLPLIAFFEDPTVSHLASLVSGGKNASQDALANIWAEVLGLPKVETNANFFDLGGDSLKAMEVIARVSEVLRVDLPLIAFFEDPTVAHLAAVVDELKPVGESASSITRVADRHEFPLSYSQQVFWLVEQQHPGTGLYNTPRIFRVRGHIDAAVLERSLNELRRRHEILQVRFVQRDHGPMQVFEPVAPLRLAITDFSAMESDSRDQAAMDIALQTVREPFDLERGPTLRARLVKLSEEDYLLCMAMHHVVSDGSSGSILLDELVAIYDAFAAGERDTLSTVELHFTDYAVWERQWMQGKLLDQELEHWRSVLRGAAPSVTLPTDFLLASGPDRNEHMRSVMVPTREFRRLKDLAQTHATTLFTVLAAGLRILLYRWSGQADFVLGTVASSRSRSATERMIGCFVNSLPLRNSISAGASAAEVLLNEKNAVMDAFAHQDCPFAKIVEAVSTGRTGTDNPLFNVGLVLQNFPAMARDGRFFKVEYVNFDIQVALLDLRLVALETPEGLEVLCEYKSQLFSEETIDALLGAYGGVLQTIATDPAQPASEVALPEALVRQAERARKRDHAPVVAITASFTAEPVGEPLNFVLDELGMKYRSVFAPYQQVFQQLLDPASLVRTADGFAVVLVRFDDWLQGDTDLERTQREKLQQVADDLISALRAAQQRPAPVIVCFCPPSRAFLEKAGWHEMLRNLEAKVADEFANDSSVLVVKSSEILDLYPVEEYEDEYAQRLGNVPYTTDFFSALGTTLARRMWGAAENQYQVIVTDCDQLLWSGDCAHGHAVVVEEGRRVLQNAVLRQRDAGMLLCLCSTNREGDVWTAFGREPEMLLQRDDFVAVAMGSQSAAEGLGTLASELGFGLESFVFLSADQDRCAEVEAKYPDVLTLQAPADPDEIPSWLKHVWAFDRPAMSQ